MTDQPPPRTLNVTLSDQRKPEAPKRGLEMSSGLATVLAALLALIGVGIGHFATTLNIARQTDSQVQIERDKAEQEMAQQRVKQEHEINLEKQKFVQQTIASILASGTQSEQQVLLRFYAEIGVIGEPYAEKILATPKEELPTKAEPRPAVQPFPGALLGDTSFEDLAIPSFGIEGGLLVSTTGPAPIQAPSPNHGAVFAEPPRFVVIDMTASDSARSTASFLARPEARASVHLLVDRDGSVFQLVPFDVVAWHAGQSSWAGVSNLNSRSIGVALINNGLLTQAPTGEWVTWTGQTVPAERVFVENAADGRQQGWERYSEAQLGTVVGVIEALKRAYPSLSEVVSQAEISPGRKLGPGPAFPLDFARQRFAAVETGRSAQ